jgi:hypothetical protein
MSYLFDFDRTRFHLYLIAQPRHIAEKPENALVMTKYINQTRSKHHHDAEQIPCQYIPSVDPHLPGHFRQMGCQKSSAVRCSSATKNQGHRCHDGLKRREFRRFGPSVCSGI